MSMSRDEVMAMTDDELRVKAAELDGWKCRRDRLRGEGWFGIWHHGDWLWCKGPLGTEMSIPDYLNDWGAAGELLEKVKAIYESTKGSILEVFTTHILSDVGGVNLNMFIGPSVVSAVSAIFYGLSPRRITEAFIIAMEENHE